MQAQVGRLPLTRHIHMLTDDLPSDNTRAQNILTHKCDGTTPDLTDA
jgi:hypothetical protein